MEPDKTLKPMPSAGRPLIVGAVILAAVVAIGPPLAHGNRTTSSPTQPAIHQLGTIAAPAGPQAPENQWIEWKAGQGAKHWQAGPFGIGVAPTLNGDLKAAKVTVTDAGGAKAEWTGDGTPWEGAASIALVRLTSTDPVPDILLTSFSGGAHCCSSLTLMRLDGSRWREIDFGSWDGDTPKLPQDLDGDGAKEFVFVDQAFLYAFASYAESWGPPVIKSVVADEVQDVSDQRRFRPAFTADAARAKAACVQKANGACAAYVASAARAGALDEAWAVMLQAYDQASDWTLPTACRLRTAGECPPDAQLTFGTFPEALQWFLGERGYTAPIYIEPLRAAGPSFDCGGVTTSGEIVVCADGALATQDCTLAVVFTRALALSRDRSALRSAQRAFLAARNTMGEQTELRSLYEARINQLLAID